MYISVQKDLEKPNPLKKNKMGGLDMSDIKIHYKVTVTRRP
jgi:hypothetical protein